MRCLLQVREQLRNQQHQQAAFASDGAADSRIIAALEVRGISSTILLCKQKIL